MTQLAELPSVRCVPSEKVLIQVCKSCLHERLYCAYLPELFEQRLCTYAGCASVPLSQPEWVEKTGVFRYDSFPMTNQPQIAP